MKDRESRYIYGNLATLDLFGCAAEELFGKEDADFFPPGTVKQIKALDNRVLEGEQTMEEVDTSGPGEDGRVFLETKTPINAAGDNQGVTGLLGISTDITESKKNERALRHWEELMRYIIEHDRSAVAVHDKAYRYIYVSKRYLEDYQVKEEDLIGKHHYDVFPDLPEKWRKAHRKALAGEVTRAEDDPYYKDDGTVEWTRWECRPWYEANGETGGFIVYTEVTTERKNMELELVAAKEKAQESDRLKTAFLANMSHEIRTPMNGILGFAQILKDPRISKAQQKHFIDVIEKSGQRLLNLLNDIIDVSRIESGHRELDLSEISVHETLQYMFGFFKPGYEEQRPGVNLVMDLPEEDIQFVTDRDKLHSILMNLLRNAEKFTLEGRVVFGCHREEDSVVWYVKDTGIGIPASKQPMIFDRFFQADISFSRGYEGAGLGLSISKAFVEMMGGRIWLESESGKGSVFYFSLPLEPDSVQKESVTEEVSPSGPQRKKGEVNLLVVDDDAASFEVIKYMLENEGFRLYHAKSGEEALDFFSTQKDLDLILMDIKMPGIDGHETTRNIRKIDRDIPVIAQTAHALSGDAEKSLASGCNDYLAKPIKKEVLLKKIRKHLR